MSTGRYIFKSAIGSVGYIPHPIAKGISIIGSVGDYFIGNWIEESLKKE